MVEALDGEDIEHHEISKSTPKKRSASKVKSKTPTKMPTIVTPRKNLAKKVQGLFFQFSRRLSPFHLLLLFTILDTEF